MKRILSVLLSLALSATLFAVAVSAVADGASWGDVPLIKETITVDGKKDEAIWSKGLQVTATKNGGGKATSRITYLHDGKYIYALAEVVDPELMPISADRDSKSWEEDGVEITFDTKNDGSTRYKVTVIHDGYVSPSGTPEAAEEIGKMFTIAVAKTSKGYNVEVKFALNNGAATGSKIGVNYLVNDMTAQNTRTMLKTENKLGAGENEVKKFDYIVLSNKLVETPKPAATTTASPATADFGLVLAAVSAVSAIGSTVLLKKKR